MARQFTLRKGSTEQDLRSNKLKLPEFHSLGR